MKDWAPGDMVAILPSSLIDRVDSNEQHWTRGCQLALVLSQSHRWTEPNELLEESHRFYVVYLSSGGAKPTLVPFAFQDEMWASPGLYVVPGNRIIDPSEAHNPGRMFGRLKPTE
jgi:hypothetical protein